MIRTQEINSAAALSVSTLDSADKITFDQCKNIIRDMLGKAIDTLVNSGSYNPDVYNNVTKKTIEDFIAQTPPAVVGFIDTAGKVEVNKLQKALMDSCLGYDVLDSVMHDDRVSEIQINDFNSIRVERSGHNEPLMDPVTGEPVSFGTRKNYRNFIDQLLMEDGKKLTETEAIIDSITKDGYRVNVIGDSATVPDRDGAYKYKPIYCTIRKQPAVKFTPDQLVKTLSC